MYGMSLAYFTLMYCTMIRHSLLYFSATGSNPLWFHTSCQKMRATSINVASLELRPWWQWLQNSLWGLSTHYWTLHAPEKNEAKYQFFIEYYLHSRNYRDWVHETWQNINSFDQIIVEQQLQKRICILMFMKRSEESVPLKLSMSAVHASEISEESSSKDLCRWQLSL